MSTYSCRYKRISPNLIPEKSTFIINTKVQKLYQSYKP